MELEEIQVALEACCNWSAPVIHRCCLGNIVDVRNNFIKPVFAMSFKIVNPLVDLLDVSLNATLNLATDSSIPRFDGCFDLFGA